MFFKKSSKNIFSKNLFFHKNNKKFKKSITKTGKIRKNLIIISYKNIFTKISSKNYFY